MSDGKSITTLAAFPSLSDKRTEPSPDPDLLSPKRRIFELFTRIDFMTLSWPFGILIIYSDKFSTTSSSSFLESSLSFALESPSSFTLCSSSSFEFLSSKSFFSYNFFYVFISAYISLSGSSIGTNLSSPSLSTPNRLLI